MKIFRETYSVWGPISHVDIIVGTTLSNLKKKFPDAESSKDKKSFTIFRGGQRIVYKRK